MTPAQRWLRWYPEAWRDRYGDEFVVLIEDTLESRRPNVRFRVSIAIAGLRQRATAAGLAGGAPREVRARMGALVVLWGWTMFVVCGCVLAKRTEHTDSAAIRAVSALAVVAGAAVALGALVALGSIIRFVRDGGWPAIARHGWRALAASAVVVVGTIGLVTWSHSLSTEQREMASGAYAVAFVGWAMSIAFALAAWTALAFAIGRRAPLSSRVLHIECALAVAVAVAMVAITVVVTVWWRSEPGLAPNQITLILTAMLGADLIAGVGVQRILGAR